MKIWPYQKKLMERPKVHVYPKFIRIKLVVTVKTSIITVYEHTKRGKNDFQLIA